MSAGPTSLNVDPSPPSHAHTHSHSRSRGHTRSPRWVPPPLSLAPESQPQPLSNGTAGYSNGETSQGSWSQHQHASGHHHHHHTHSISSVPGVDSKALSGHDPKGVNGGGMISPETPIHTSDSTQDVVHEVVTGALIALPWVALSWYSRKYARTFEVPRKEPSATENVLPVSMIGQVGQKTCAMTAITLLVFGCGQLLRMKREKGGSHGISSVRSTAINVKTAQAAFLLICSVGLPVYAALKIGGFLVAFALLLATATGIPNLVRGNSPNTSQERFNRKILTLALLAGAMLLSFFGLNQPWGSYPFMGYAALLVSILVISPPFPSLQHQGPISEPGLVARSLTAQAKPPGLNASALVVTADAPLAAISGAVLALLLALFSQIFSFEVMPFVGLLIPASLFAASLAFSLPARLRSPSKAGLAICTGAAALACSPHFRDDYFMVYVARIILSTVSFFTSRMDDSHLRLDAHSHNHTHHRHPSQSHGIAESWRLTKWIVNRSEPYPLLYSILKEKDSRSIFFFMCLNFAFMLVQLAYGILTGSLGLLSDSIHMFFDCLALIVGLCAAVMSKWPPNARFPYGYGKVDTLSGFANGIFLMIISLEIIYEAVERLSTGSQMHRISELLAVSIAGLAVNLVGIFSFEHGHAHHGHDHGHDHSHGNENMHGIFLHILADTLGSVAVVISTVLVHYSGWSGYDPLASCFIAILIFASAVPLVSSTAQTLLLTLPADTEYNVRETLAGNQKVLGVIHVIASRGADLEDVRQRTVNFLQEKNMDIVVQVERDGDGRCWCGGGNKGI
ncbi:hypothetical protein N7510_009409 [Penicillium lagena]|uniref:uncharacterized protein n=1 Tax=Penicillium lagena TaxID=94218 RepID=UPI002540ED36|nr:uncharacterized protein N7510_009409 [Penicillium lagena]KAJ5606628.1 hypothetical protein N7510_009409 [Penicillium lagena]